MTWSEVGYPRPPRNPLLWGIALAVILLLIFILKG